ncbi:MAG: SirB2 family protein [Proteobacteria bacterium]|nr:SirB2 family protein [Pseudomonadota bacterium]
MTFLAIKYLHTIAAVVTISGFLLRGYWMLTESGLLHHRVTRTAPHVVDAVLFAAGLAMLWILHLNPFVHAWLVAKFIGLAVYVVLGTIAIKRGPTKRIRAVALVAAVAAFAYVAGVALAKSPLSWLGV